MESELQRLRKIIVRMGVFLIIVLVAVVAYFSAQLREVRNTLYTASSSQKQPLNGLDGEDGKDGLSILGPQGQPGAAGQNAVSTNTIIERSSIFQQNIPIPGPPGVPGVPGEPGPAAKELQLGKQDNELVYRYTGDTIWQTVEEVQ